MRFGIVLLLAALAVCAAGAPRPRGTRFGVPMKRVALRLTGPCAAHVESSVDLPHKDTSPHPWHALPHTPHRPGDHSDFAFAHSDTTPALSLSAAAAQHCPSPPSSTAPTGAGDITRLVTIDHGGAVMAHAFDDPRYVRLHCGHHHDTATKADAFTIEPTAVEPLWVPRTTSSVRLYCNTTAIFTTLRLPAKEVEQPKVRAFKEASQRRGVHTQATKQPTVKEISVVGPPTKQYNIILLAAGYTADMEATFFQNATDIAYLMEDPGMNPLLPVESDDALHDMHRSVPFNRYWALWNIYAVFEPSNQGGASRPLLSLNVDNNLGCKHPAEVERAVFCDRELALSLASVTPGDVRGDPERNIIIVVVNTHIYGGSAFNIPGKIHVGHFFNGFSLSDPVQKRKMLSLTDHEMGHAFGNLMDEYSVGTSEPTDRQLANCQIGNGGGPPSTPRWKHWIDMKAADPGAFHSAYGSGVRSPQWDILAVPQPVCGFTNYYKPNANCMMHRLNDYFMCPVCREQSTVALFGTHFELTWPRHPLPDVVVLIPTPALAAAKGASLQTVTTNTSVVLHLPAQLTDSSGFNVVWRDVDGSLLEAVGTKECPACVSLNATNFAKYPRNTLVRVSAFVTDTTLGFLSTKYRGDYPEQLQQNASFALMVVDDAALLDNATLTEGKQRSSVGIAAGDNLAAFTSCGAPGSGANASDLLCSMNYTHRIYESPKDIGALLGQYDTWVLVGLAALVLLLILLWLWAAAVFTKSSNTQIQPVFRTKYTPVVNIVRMVMMAAAVVFLLVAVASIGASVYFYVEDDTSTLGKVALAFGCCLAVVLYFMAFFGFWFVSARRKKFLAINGVILLLGLVVAVAVWAIIQSLGTALGAETGFKVNFGGVVGNETASVVGYWSERLEDMWTGLTVDEPSLICGIQKSLKCSGYYSSCVTIIGSTNTCPSNCQETNLRYADPCHTILRRYIVDHYATVVKVVAVATGLLALGLVFNFVYFFGLFCNKREVRKDNVERVRRASMDGARSAQRLPPRRSQPGMPSPKSAAPTPGTESKYKALFLLKSLDTSTTASLVKEFYRIDLDGSGELDRQELTEFFAKSLCYRPRKEEIDSIFEIADLDGNGSISLQEFLTLFNDPADMARIAADVAALQRRPSHVKQVVNHVPTPAQLVHAAQRRVSRANVPPQSNRPLSKGRKGSPAAKGRSSVLHVPGSPPTEQALRRKESVVAMRAKARHSIPEVFGRDVQSSYYVPPLPHRDEDLDML